MTLAESLIAATRMQIQVLDQFLHQLERELQEDTIETDNTPKCPSCGYEKFHRVEMMGGDKLYQCENTDCLFTWDGLAN